MEKQGGSEAPSVKTESYTYTASSFRQLTYEKELFELVQLSDVPLDQELFKVILELLKENVAPTAIVQVLKALRSAADTTNTSIGKVQFKTDSQDAFSDSTHLAKSHTQSSIDSTSTHSLDSDNV